MKGTFSFCWTLWKFLMTAFYLIYFCLKFPSADFTNGLNSMSGLGSLHSPGVSLQVHAMS